jgi:hypothetical protein
MSNKPIDVPTSVEDVCQVLRPLFDIGDVRDLNLPSSYRLPQKKLNQPTRKRY